MSCDIHVELGERSYPIYIGSGVLDQLGSRCSEVGLKGCCLVISDVRVAAHYAAAALQALESAGFEPALATVPAGEPAKSNAQLMKLYSACIKAGLDRRAFIVALGGGVTGDLAGYAAASFLRGIPFVQVPTSLLAMVDSAIGGKTGINLPEGKNMVGAFHQPALVLADLQTLATLPAREYRSGMAEVVKYGMIRDAALFGLIESRRADLRLEKDADLLAEMVGRCCKIKAEVVTNDEREDGLRAILNFGHTMGHAVENAVGYGGEFTHGEAVSIGMVYAAHISVEQSGLSPAESGRMEALLTAWGLPTSAPGITWEPLCRAMAVDKKAVNGEPRFVLASAVGTVSAGHAVETEVLKEIWGAMG